MGMHFDWSDERVATAQRLWTSGKSASQIAFAIGGGISRNAVIGKLTRLGFKRNMDRSAKTKGAVRSRVPLAVKPIVSRSIKPQNIVRKAASRAHDLGIKADINLPRHVALLNAAAARAAQFACERLEPPTAGTATIMELTNRHCRWPFGDPHNLESFRYCGGNKAPEDGPYCAAHGQLASRRMTQCENGETS